MGAAGWGSPEALATAESRVDAELGQADGQFPPVGHVSSAVGKEGEELGKTVSGREGQR